MEITVSNTTKIVQVNGVPARVWEGKTASGIPVHCFVTRIAVSENADCFQFDQELKECRKPSPEVEAIDFRLIL